MDTRSLIGSVVQPLDIEPDLDQSGNLLTSRAADGTAHLRGEARMIIPAATVPFVCSSTRMKLPVTRLRRYSS